MEVGSAIAAELRPSATPSTKMRRFIECLLVVLARRRMHRARSRSVHRALRARRRRARSRAHRIGNYRGPPMQKLPILTFDGTVMAVNVDYIVKIEEREGR